MEPRPLQFGAQFGGVGDVAVVRHRDAALVAGDREGLRVEQHRVAGGGVARVADGAARRAASPSTALVKISATWPMDLWQWISAAVAGADAGAFLAAMLQRVEAQIGQLGGFRMAVDGDDAALFVEFIEHSISKAVSQPSLRSAAIALGSAVSMLRISARFSDCDDDPTFHCGANSDASTAWLAAISTTRSGSAVEIRMREGPSWNSSSSGRRSESRSISRADARRSEGRIRPAPRPGRHRSDRAPIRPVPLRRSRAWRRARASRNPGRAPAAGPRARCRIILGVLRAAEADLVAGRRCRPAARSARPGLLEVDA